MFDTAFFHRFLFWLNHLPGWFESRMLGWGTAEQLGYAVVAFLFTRFVLRYPAASLEKRAQSISSAPLARIATVVSHFIPWLCLLLLLQLGSLAFCQAGEHDDLLRLIFSLVLAWVIIRLSSGLVRDPTLSRTIAIAGWLIAALNIAGLIGPAIVVLDSLAITVGKLRISLFLLIKGALALVVLLWLANLIAG